MGLVDLWAISTYVWCHYSSYCSCCTFLLFQTSCSYCDNVVIGHDLCSVKMTVTALHRRWQT